MRFSTIIPLLATIGTALAGPIMPGVANDGLDPATGTYCPATRGRVTPQYQKRIFEQFVDTMYGDHDVKTAFDKHVDVDLIEHAPYDPQGRDAVAAKLAPIFAAGTYDIMSWNFDNNIGMVFIRIYRPDGNQVALIDLFRMNGTCIEEHWDVNQVRPLDATNPIAMF